VVFDCWIVVASISTDAPLCVVCWLECAIFLTLLVFVFVSDEGRMVDALASRADEGRGRLRYASGSCQPSVDPRMSEWGNPARVMSCHLTLNV
jgi:hypothetical protein